jgi:hypothetical protein
MRRFPCVAAGLLLCVAAGLLLVAAAACGGGPPTSPTSVSYDVRTPEGLPLVVRHAFPTSGLALFARDASTGALRALPLEQREEPGVRVEGLLPSETAVLWASGCRDLPLSGGPPPAVLRYGPLVRLRVRAEGGFPPPPAELWLEVRWRGPGDAVDAPERHGFPPAAPEGSLPVAPRQPRIRLAATAADPEATFRVSAPGRHRVRGTYMEVEPTSGGRFGSGFGLDEGIVLDVLDLPGEQVFDWALPRSALRKD